MGHAPAKIPEMVERATRAAYAKAMSGSKNTWENARPTERVVWLAIITAAMDALREPTDAMLDAPWRAQPSVQLYEPTDLTQVLDCVSFERVWQAMIDAALKD